MDTIYFYSHRGPFGDFSNFWSSPFTDPDTGLNYWCSEQFFMKAKQELFDPENTILGQAIMNSTSATHIKRLGRSVQNYDDRVWSEHRYQIMVKGLYYKFSQSPELRARLISTGTYRLAEASPTDTIWGIGLSIVDAQSGKPWRGQNLLGQALMEVRSKLQAS